MSVVSGVRPPAEQARAVEKAIIDWRADLRRKHEKRLREEQEAGAYLSPPRTEDDPTLSDAPPPARRRPTRAEDDADWFRRASVPWPSGTR
jgi:hypothetical protein